MPRDANGAYSLPAGYLATQGDTIQPSQHNPPLEDLASSMTASLPRTGVAPMTGPLKIADGTVGAPSLAFASQPASGWYKTAGGIALTINGALVEEWKSTDGGVTTAATNYDMVAGDNKRLIRVTVAGVTVKSPDATVVGVPFIAAFLNDTTGEVTIDGFDAQTIDGRATIIIPAGSGFRMRSDGTNWHTEGLNFRPTQITPQCYLTLLSVVSSPLSPIPTSDQTGKSIIYCRPDGGNLTLIPDGTTFAVREFSELTLTLNSNHVANGIYDIFKFADPATGAITLGTGPVWNTVTAGSGDRGTGAGTTELDLLKGLKVNKNAITMRNGATTYSIAAKCALLVGGLSITANAGEVACTPQYGQSRRWDLWNNFNRRQILIKAGDGTASWNYSINTLRVSNNNAANSLTVFVGLADTPVMSRFKQVVGDSGANGGHLIGIGLNDAVAVSGFSPLFSGLGGGSITGEAEYDFMPSLGIQRLGCLEKTPTAATSLATYYGTETNMLLTAKWMG